MNLEVPVEFLKFFACFAIYVFCAVVLLRDIEKMTYRFLGFITLWVLANTLVAQVVLKKLVTLGAIEPAMFLLGESAIGLTISVIGGISGSQLIYLIRRRKEEKKAKKPCEIRG